MLGRRKSQSISRTRTPFWANTTAQLMLVVLLPSWGRALVTIMTLGGAPRWERRRDVRRARYDSAICDCGRACVISSTASFDEASTRRLDEEPARAVFDPSGIIP